jgi:hypothetical protein
MQTARATQRASGAPSPALTILVPISILKWHPSSTVVTAAANLAARGEEDEGREGRAREAGGEGESDKTSDILALTGEEVITGAALDALALDALDLDALGLDASNAEAAQTLTLNPATCTQNTNPATNNVGGTAAAAAALSDTNRQTSVGQDPANITVCHDGQAAKGLDSKDTMSRDGGTGRAGRKYEYEYEGEWQHGLRHGEGRLLYPTGETYVGEWIKNVRHGVGLLSAVGFTYEVKLLRTPCKKVRSSYTLSRIR